MGNEVKSILEKTASYISATQPVVDEYNQFKEDIIKEAHETIGVLVSRGLVEEEKKAATIDSLINEPLKVYGLVRGLADSLDRARSEKSASSLGWVSSEGAAVDDLDSFDRWVLYGDHRANGVSSSNL